MNTTEQILAFFGTVEYARLWRASESDDFIGDLVFDAWQPRLRIDMPQEEWDAVMDAQHRAEDALEERFRELLANEEVTDGEEEEEGPKVAGS